MKNLRKLFGNLFLKAQKGNEHKAILRQDEERENIFVAPYKKGDLIGGKYEVYDVLGKGGFGVVYLVYSHQTESVYALKTFRDEYLDDSQTRKQFKKEANVWINLERHPNIVRASFVDEIAGRLYIAMEYIAPDEEGFNTLENFLQRRSPNFVQSLHWAIQFCYGMEYINSKGIHCHRDVKPANILISKDKTLKISDFGLARVFDAAKTLPEIKLNLVNDRIGLSFQTLDGAVGTPTHMPPEQFINAAYCDERSDIYSFGIVLYQMRNGGRVPFLAPLPKDGSSEEARRFWISMRKLHSEANVPKINSRLSSIIYRCLEKKPHKRYQSFMELREDLEYFLRSEIGEMVMPPEVKEDEILELTNKGYSLISLSRYDNAIHFYDLALKIDSQDSDSLMSKGVCLYNLGQFDEAILCYNKALEINPQLALAWSNKGLALHDIGYFDEAIRCYDKALEINPQLVFAWSNKGLTLENLHRYEDAIECINKALEIDERLVNAWNTKGICLKQLGRYDEANHCYDKALEIDPQFVMVWNNKGVSLKNLRRFYDAIQCYNKVIEIDSRNAVAWYNKALAEDMLGLKENAIHSFKQFITLSPNGAYQAEIDHGRKRLEELEKRSFSQ